MARIEIDTNPRKCRCGHYRNGKLDSTCAERCLAEFSIMQYPPGYFEYKYQVRKGSNVNTCPICESAALTEARQVQKGNSSEFAFDRRIKLIQTWRIADDQHRKNALRTHGPEVLKVMEEVADLEDRSDAAKRVIASMHNTNFTD